MTPSVVTTSPLPFVDLQRENPEHWGALLDRLGADPSASSAQTLEQIARGPLNSPVDQLIRLRASTLRLRLGVPVTMPFLRWCLQEGDDVVRETAAEQLRRASLDDLAAVTDSLRVALVQDPSPRVRYEAIALVPGIRDAEARERCIVALESDPARAIREAVRTAGLSTRSL